MKYRKKPVVIEAMQWNGKNYLDLCVFAGCDVISAGNSDELIVHTLEGNMIASLNDYIIKGVQGEFYPCKPDIFEQTYEVVND